MDGAFAAVDHGIADDEWEVNSAGHCDNVVEISVDSDDGGNYLNLVDSTDFGSSIDCCHSSC